MNSEIASAFARFFEGGKGPSHDELSRLFKKTGLSPFDPAETSDESVGKLKRVRGGLLTGGEAAPAEALAFVRDLTAMLKGRGCFNPSTGQYAGHDVVEAAQQAMRGIGWRLYPSGDLEPERLSSLEGQDLSTALQQYVRRIQRSSDDQALTIGSAKDLLEAVARHVMVEANGSYDAKTDFVTTLFRASTAVGTGTPTGKMISELDADAFTALEQALLLAAIAISRLRNVEGTGHGRPQPTRATRRQGVIAAEAAAAVSYVLITELTA